MRPFRADVVLIAVVLVAAYALYPAMAAAVSPSPGPSPGGAATPVASPGAAGGDLQFRNATAEANLSYQYAFEYSGTQSMLGNAGVYASDYDGDGWTDVLALGGERPVLFENRGGTFARSGALPALNRSFHAALFLDYDDDGRDDLLLLPRGGRPVFLENRPDGFVRADVGLNVTLGVPTSAAAADFDGNGCLDVFVTQNGNWSDRRPAGLRNYSVPAGADNGGRNLLLSGDCESFETVTAAAGVRGTHWSLVTSAADLDGDGDPDLHVANDFGHDVVYETVDGGEWAFDRRRLGDRTNRNGMSSEVADLTGDGRRDVFVTNIYFPTVLDEVADASMELRADGNNLLVGGADGTFREAASEHNVERGGWGWAAAAVDFTNDGRLDLFHATRNLNLEQYRRTLSDAEITWLRTQFPAFSHPALWTGTADGFARRDAADAGFEALNGRGVAHLDYDRDGRMDLVVATVGGTYTVYENVGASGRALQVRLRGEGPSPVGATVTVETAAGTQFHAYNAKTDYHSQSTRVLHFGAGSSERATVTVTWPDGTTRTFDGVATGQRITVTREGIVRRTPFESAPS